MKVLLFIDCFEGGGAARLMSVITNGLVNRGHEVCIAANYNRPVLYDLSSHVKRLAWYKDDYYQKSTLAGWRDLLRDGRRFIKDEKPDVIISTVYHIVLLSRLAGIGLNVPYIFADVTTFSRRDDKFIHFVRYHVYKFSDAVTIQTENDKKILGKRLPQKVVISNPLPYSVFEGESNRDHSVLVIGHTDRWKIKGLDIMMRVWGKVAPMHSEWRLKIIGGDAKESKRFLLDIACQYGVQDSVDFLGFRTDADTVMRESSIYALTSRVEGFSLSLIESMSQGLPAVAFKIDGVITDVTENGHGTLLVEDGDEDSFADALEKLISDESLREIKAAEAKTFVTKYSPDEIVSQWEKLIMRFGKKH